MHALRWVGFGGGIVLFVVTSGSLMRTLVVPRGLSSGLVSMVERATRGTFLFIADRFHHYRTKDRVLAFLGPTTMVGLLLAWLVSFLFAFALVLWPLIPGSFASALSESGSSMFTLGFLRSPGGGATAVHFAAAATGLIVVALQIAYLPTLYGAFNRREMLVTTLQSRAGVPAWGPEILARHQLNGLLDTMRRFYGDWEDWAADLAETHSSYPILITFRSPHPLRSWVLALLSVMDSAAMYHALCPTGSPAEARICLRMGFTALRDIAASIRMDFDPDPMPTDTISMTYDEFLAGVRRLEEVGFPFERAPEDAWPHFHGWRVNYESLAYALADRVVAAPAMWSGARRHVPGAVIEPLRPVDRRVDDTSSMERAKRTDDWRV